MQATTFERGIEALRSMKERNYDVAVLDMLMPEMDGIELAKEIRKINTDLPLVLFSSAGLFPEDRREDRALFAGMVEKPIKTTYFQKMLIEKLSSAEQPKKTSKLESNILTQQSKDLAHASILIAEDNLINQKIITKTINTIGYSCDVVSNGLEVLSSMKRQHYDLIFMDVQMPEMDGLEATRKIRQEHKGKQPLIIAMTAAAYEDDKTAAINAGMNDYMTKPFNFDDFRAKFAGWIAKV
jgi:CheY-like chemotaxis protein